MRFRMHAGSFEDSMATCVDLPTTIYALAAHIKEWNFKPVIPEKLEAVRYGDVDRRDPRGDWDTHIVKVDGLPIGFTDQPVPTLFSNGKNYRFLNAGEIPQVGDEVFMHGLGWMVLEKGTTITGTGHEYVMTGNTRLSTKNCQLYRRELTKSPNQILCPKP